MFSYYPCLTHRGQKKGYTTVHVISGESKDDGGMYSPISLNFFYKTVELYINTVSKVIIENFANKFNEITFGTVKGHKFFNGNATTLIPNFSKFDSASREAPPFRFFD